MNLFPFSVAGLRRPLLHLAPDPWQQARGQQLLMRDGANGEEHESHAQVRFFIYNFTGNTTTTLHVNLISGARCSPSTLPTTKFVGTLSASRPARGCSGSAWNSSSRSSSSSLGRGGGPSSRCRAAAAEGRPPSSLRPSRLRRRASRYGN